MGGSLELTVRRPREKIPVNFRDATNFDIRGLKEKRLLFERRKRKKLQAEECCFLRR